MEKEKTTQIKAVVLNTPTTINLMALFPEASLRDKAIFIIHQLNHWTIAKGEYNLNKDDHREFLALTSQQFTTIKQRLINAELIRLTKEWIPKQQAEHYAMVKTFDIKNEKESVKHL